MPGAPVVYMDRIGAVIAGVGVLSLLIGLLWRRGSVPAFVQTGAASTTSPGRFIAVEGNVFCPDLLVSPMTGTSCLFYRVTCTARWREGDFEHALVVEAKEVAARFSLDDGSGPIAIDARFGGEIEPREKQSMTKSVSLDRGTLATELAFGHHRVAIGAAPAGARFTLEEEVLPWLPRLYARGGVADDQRTIGAHPKRSLSLSSPSTTSRLAEPSSSGRGFFVPGAFASAFGAGLTIAGLLFAKESAAEVGPKPIAVTSPPPPIVGPPVATVALVAPTAAIRMPAPPPLPKAKPPLAKPASKPKSRKAPETG